MPGGPRPDPLQLADTTLYLPTRRATRALQEAFLGVSGGRALLLPKIKAIAEGSDDLELIASVADFADGADQPSRTMSELERQLTLTSLVLRWAQSEARPARTGDDILPFAAAGARTPAQAVKLAQELARLIDELENEGIDVARLTELVPEEFSEHWSGTLAFLQIVTQFWPAHLAEHGLVSAVARRKRLMQAAAERLRAAPPEAPVIVAGLTRADPAGLDLIQAVMGLPNGALVLPPLDRTLDEESWASIGEHPEHPQFGLKKLIDALGLARADIQPLAGGRAHPGAAFALVARMRGHAARRHHRALAPVHARHRQAADGCGLDRNVARRGGHRRGGSGGRRADAARGGGDPRSHRQPDHARSQPRPARSRAARDVGRPRRGHGGPAVRRDACRHAARSDGHGGGEGVRARRADGAPQAPALPRRHGRGRFAAGDQRRGACGVPLALFRQGAGRR